MNKRKTSFLGALTILIITFTLLITGSPLLTHPLSYNHNIPLGTFISWFGIISLQISVYLGVKKITQPNNLFYRSLKSIIKTSFMFSLLWIVICYFLAGNLSFIFTEKEEFQGGQLAMKLFWNFTYILLLIPSGSLITHWIFSLFKKQ